MAKGLGAIMAQVKIAEEKERLSKGEGVECPLCGREMEGSGVGWFCYGGPPHRGQCEMLLPLLEAFHELPWDDRPVGHPCNDFQGQTLAAIVDRNGPRILAELTTTRGHGGKTNLRIFESEGVEPSEIPELVRGLGWTFMDWVHEAINQ